MGCDTVDGMDSLAPFLADLESVQEDIGRAVKAGAWDELAELLTRRQAFLENGLSDKPAMNEKEKKQLQQVLGRIMRQDQAWVEQIKNAKSVMKKQFLDLKRSRSSIKAYE